ncbi:MAG: bifunctional UDP-N-acetylglucosamine diphosphorylase/glucosamine-1-phosphate N-acetyltransferase GlmU [Candidatus Aquilonibacter sp.]|jgi:bifunctional UDP-N-acetylglucosamine pyrophosphorylase/glucosamine-1-phosphate N-acetyltransferase
MSVRAIVLAAGKGTRMKSRVTKVLHEVCGRPMLWYTLRELRAAGIDDIVVVTNDELQARIAEFDVPGIVQREQLGTGHAVKIALDATPQRNGSQVVIAYGDMPLVPSAVFSWLLDALDGNAGTTGMTMITAKMPVTSNFGRVVRNGEKVERIVEVRDATPQERLIDEMNAGIYAYDENSLREAVTVLNNDNAQGEYYLTDTVADFVRNGKRVMPLLINDPLNVLGVNDRVELAIARREMNARICAAHMRDGVTILDPATTYLEPELRIGCDTVIYPNTAISLLTTIGENCAIGPNTRISDSRIGNGVTVCESVVVQSEIGDDSKVGPFAHIRGHAKLAGHNRVGNFVEIKNSQYARGAKSAHLSYLGDTTIGEETNIGAGTITCNFDGQRKNKTTIGKNVSIGSNTSIVAPRTIGDGALTGAGSVVTKDVAPGERVAGNPAKPLPKK